MAASVGRHKRAITLTGCLSRQSHCPQESRCLIRLSNTSERTGVAPKFVLLNVRRGKNHWKLRMASLDLLEKIHAAELWHPIVGNHDVEMSFPQFIESRNPVAGRDDVVSVSRQNCPHAKPRMMVIIDDEHSFAISVHPGLSFLARPLNSY